MAHVADQLGEMLEHMKRGQMALKILKYYSGPIDGKWGPITQQAYLSYAADWGVSTDDFKIEDVIELERRAGIAPPPATK
jgi:peptidoglycan hydrolase-like protein with peptidoglycan-binding domain